MSVPGRPAHACPLFPLWATAHVGHNQALARFSSSLPLAQPPYMYYTPDSFQNWRAVLLDTVFALAPRGYGRSSFRQAEVLQAGSIPVYL